jgi:hypothetical protein
LGASSLGRAALVFTGVAAAFVGARSVFRAATLAVFGVRESSFRAVTFVFPELFGALVDVLLLTALSFVPRAIANKREATRCIVLKVFEDSGCCFVRDTLRVFEEETLFVLAGILPRCCFTSLRRPPAACFESREAAVVFPLDVPAVFPDDLRVPFCFALRDDIP